MKTKKMLRYFSILLLGLLTKPSFSFSTHSAVPIDTLDKAKIDSSLFNIKYPELALDYAMKSNRLNPYGFEVSLLVDSICLTLTDTVHCSFHMPNLGRVNSTFGWRGRRVHSGIDLQLHWGDTVNAAFDGVVRVSKYGKGYGNYIIIRHENGLETLYAHLQKRFVVKNDTVHAGNLIGLGGSTGRSTGAHLHFETRFLGRPIDPELFIDFQQNRLKQQSLFIHAETFDVPRSKRSKRMF